MSSRRALSTQGDGGDEQQLAPNLPALILLKRTRGFLWDNNKNLPMRSAQKCGADQISAFSPPFFLLLLLGTERSPSAAHLQMAQTEPWSQRVAASSINPLEFAQSVRNCPQTLWIKGRRRGSGTTGRSTNVSNHLPAPRWCRVP